MTSSAAPSLQAVAGALVGAPDLLARVVDLLAGIPGMVGAVVVLALVLRSLRVVAAHQRRVYVDDDGAATVLEPGVHVRNPLSRAGVALDLRERSVESTFEAVETADGVQAELDVVLEFSVADPAAAVTETDDYAVPLGAGMNDHEVALVEALEVTLLDEARTWAWEDLRSAPGRFAADCEAELVPAAETFGVAVESFAIDAVREHEAGDGL